MTASSRIQSLLLLDALNTSRNGFALSVPLSKTEFLIILQYGLQSAFKEIERLGHEVTDAGNPISMNLKT